MCAWTGDRSCHTQRPDDGGGWDARSWTGAARCLECVRSTRVRLGCDVIGLQDTRRSGHSAFSQADYLVYCGGECGGENCGEKGKSGVGLAVRAPLTRAARPPEFISDRLLKVPLELRGRAESATFFVS